MKILPSQIILLIVMAAFVIYVLSARRQLTDRVILLVLSVGGILLVLFPDASTWLANRIGIGRGTDMLFYFFIVFVLFRFVGISREQRETQKKLTEIVRAQAIQSAQEGKSAPDDGEEK